MNSLKYFIDIIQLVYYLKSRMDYPRLFKVAAVHGTWRRITRTLRIVYQEFPQLESVQKLSLSAEANLWWDLRAMRDVKGRSLQGFVNYASFHLLDFDTMKHCLAGIMDWLLPSKAAIGYELGRHDKEKSLFYHYWRVYINRGRNIIRFIGEFRIKSE